MNDKKIVTHDGNFHADDVFSVAALKCIFPSFELIRTRNPEIIAKADIVLDVGGEYWSSSSRISGFSNAAVGEPVESELSLCTSAGDAPPLRARGEPGTLEPGLLGSLAPLAPNLN